MAQIDELDFERARNLLAGFGWKVEQTEIKATELEMKFVKTREEPETDITVQPS